MNISAFIEIAAVTDVANTNAAGSDVDTSIRPFKYRATDVELAVLRRRIMTTRFPERETVADRSQGVQLATQMELARYWAAEYDWCKVEARIDALPNFVTEIDGLDIHFIHIRSKHENALPVIVTHGWPGSFIEQLKIIEPLTNPTANGGTAADAFHVVIPSIPGYGFSGKPTATGWDPAHIARAWAVLMIRLGYTRYVAQGSDWGAIITDLMAAQAPPGLIGMHTNMPGVVPPEIDAAALAGAPTPSGLAEDEECAYEKLVFAYKYLQYAFYMRSQPQTLTALTDSPVGLAIFMLDHYPLTLDLIAQTFGGQSGGITRDDVLDNVTLYWLTNTAISAARLYRENMNVFFAPKNVAIPVAVSVFPDELFQAPRSWTQRAYPKLVYYNRTERGGHYPAWEQPAIFTSELRAGFRSLR